MGKLKSLSQKGRGGRAKEKYFKVPNRKQTTHGRQKPRQKDVAL
jgi:hypothetical protein